jgi:hypothetical protein
VSLESFSSSKELVIDAKSCNFVQNKVFIAAFAVKCGEACTTETPANFKDLHIKNGDLHLSLFKQLLNKSF